MTEAERVKLENDVYAAVFPLLATYETRGYNAHQRAQSIGILVTGECRNWITRQTTPIPDTTELPATAVNQAR